MAFSGANPDGSVTADFSLPERALISSLAHQIAVMLTDLAALRTPHDDEVAALFDSVGIGGSSTLNADPAIARLLPNAYADDEVEASREFRLYTERSLASRKLSNARTVVASLTATEPEFTLSPLEVQAWMRTLTDIRLTIATRLGIDSDDDQPIDESIDEGSLALRDVYDWLGWVSESLIDAIDS